MRDRADDGLNLARREEASCVAAPAQCVSIVARVMPASRHQDHPRLRRKLTAEEFARLEHVVMSLRGGEFATPVDKTLARLGLKRNVVLSAASFLFVPEIVTNSNFVALVPARLVSHRDGRLKVVACPLPIEGFAIGMAWHERNHGHSGHRWIRHLIASLVGSETGDRKRRATRPQSPGVHFRLAKTSIRINSAVIVAAQRHTANDRVRPIASIYVSRSHGDQECSGFTSASAARRT